MKSWTSFLKSLVATGLIGMIGACISTPYPDPDQPIGLRERIAACFIAIPTFEIFGLSGYDNVTKARYPGQCEVWFEFEKFKSDIGQSEVYVAETGRALEYEYDYVLDALKRTITYEPSGTVEVAGVEHRVVTTNATIVGENGRLTAQSRTVWQNSGRSWQLASLAPEEVFSALAESNTKVSQPAPEICRLVQGDGNQSKFCRNENGDWVEVS